MPSIMAEPSTFAERLDAAMTAAGLNQQQLAARIGVSKQTVSAWVNGRNIPQLNLALRLARALNVKIEDLCDQSWASEGCDPGEEA